MLYIYYNTDERKEFAFFKPIIMSFSTCIVF